MKICRNSLLLVLSSSVFVVLALFLNSSDIYDNAHKVVNSTTLPDSVLKTGSSARLLRALPDGVNDLRLQRFDSMSDVSLQSQVAIGEQFLKNDESISISLIVDDDDLNDSELGILANPIKRGQNWERAAYVAFYRGSKLLHTQGVGVRVHGGNSRFMSKKSLRLYARSLYGRPTFDVDELNQFNMNSASTIILHNDVRNHVDNEGRSTKWHYNNLFAYESVSNIGIVVPEAIPIRFYLNGVDQGPYVLKEHISKSFFESRYEHTNFTVSRMKVDGEFNASNEVVFGDRNDLIQLHRWARSLPAPIDLEQLNTKLDIENMTDWFVGALFFGVTDPYQGAIVKDNSVPDSRWFWIGWDMDHAFMDLYNQANEPYQLDLFTAYLGLDRPQYLRSYLFFRLIHESENYRSQLRQKLLSALSGPFSVNSLMALHNKYKSIHSVYGVSEAEYLEKRERFLKERHRALRVQISKYLD